MSGIFQYFDFISHSEFTKQNNDKDIVIPISQIEKLRIDRFDNISQGRERISCKAKIQTEVVKVPNSMCLHIIKIRLRQSKMAFFVLLVLYIQSPGLSLKFLLLSQ